MLEEIAVFWGMGGLGGGGLPLDEMLQQDVNKTEYIVLEMTSVISIDSTAAHILHDIVSDFRKKARPADRSQNVRPMIIAHTFFVWQIVSHSSA